MSRTRAVAPFCLGLLLTLSVPATPPEPAVAPAADEGSVAEPPVRSGYRTTALSAVLGARLADGAASATTGDRGDRGHRGDRRRTTLWGWPLLGTPDIARPYDPPAQRWLPGHRGVDLAGVRGEPVLSVEAGVVSYSGEIAGVGVLSVTHSDGLRSTYQPVVDRVARGSRVGRGQEIGTLDLGGHCVLHDCLHLGARRGETYVDPTPLLLGVELTLLPVAP